MGTAQVDQIALLDLDILINQRYQKDCETVGASIRNDTRPPVFRGANLEIQSYRGREFLLSGPSDCLAGETLIYDPSTGESLPIKELAERGKPITVLTAYGPRPAGVPFRKGIAKLYRVKTTSGKSLLATAHHRVLTRRGWTLVADLIGEPLLLSDPFPMASSSDISLLTSQPDGRHYCQKVQGSKDRCFGNHHPYGERLPSYPDSAQATAPLQGDALSHTHVYRGLGELGYAPGHSHHRQLSVHLSTGDYLRRIGEISGMECCVLAGTVSRDFCLCQHVYPSQKEPDLQLPISAVHQCVDSRHLSSHRSAGIFQSDAEMRVLSATENPAFESLFLCSKSFDMFPESDNADLVSYLLSFFSSYNKHYTAHADTVSSVEYERTDEYFDMHVPGAEHYYAGGFWNHNTGKTWATLYLLDTLLRSTPRSQAVLARKTRASLFGTVILTYRKILDLQEALGNGTVTVYGGERPEWYEYPNGAKLWLGGMDNPNKILSGERDWIYINQAEELALGDWEILLTRATGRGAVTKTPMLFGDCNPSAENHWIIKSRPTLKLFHSKHKDNPSLYDEQGNVTEGGKLRIFSLQSLTGVRKARLYEGKWVGAEGLFFEEWDEDLHTCKPFEIPKDWPVWGAFDWGVVHPSAFGLFTEKDGTIYLIGEHVRNKWLPPMHCRAIRRLMESCNIDPWRVKQIVAGHDCFQTKGDSQGKTIAQQYMDAIDPETSNNIGLVFEKANIARVSGATELLTRLGNAEFHIPPRLKIFKTCPKTIATMPRMVGDPDDAEDVKKVDADANGEGDDCFIPGTVILSASGPLPIEAILVGDYVLTRAGYRRVKAIWQSRASATVIRATFSNGIDLVGTPNHPCFLRNGTLKALDTLRYGDIMNTLWQNQMYAPKQSYLTEWSFVGIPMLDRHLTATTIRPVGIGLSEECGRFTSKYGSRFMAQFLREATFIIKMKTRSITALRIWFALLRESILKNISLTQTGWLRPEDTLTPFGLWHPLGMHPRLAGLGIAGTPKQHLRNEYLPRELVNSAVARTVRPFLSILDSAPINASPSGDAMLDLIQLQSPVNAVANLFPRTSIRDLDSAQGFAQDVRLEALAEAGKSTTYSIHVDGQHEFYANGILVKNCYDMLRYGVMLRHNAVPIVGAYGGTQASTWR